MYAKDLYDTSKRRQLPCLDTTESLEGQDRDGDGIRDDVGLFIALNFEGKLAIRLRSYALATRRALTEKMCKGSTTPSGCMSMSDAMMCVSVADVHGPHALTELVAVMNNTPKRRSFTLNKFWSKAFAPSDRSDEDACMPTPIASTDAAAARSKSMAP